MTSLSVLFVGRTTLDAVYWLDHLPQEDTKAFAVAFRNAPGGPACNAAITHAMLAGQATLISAVGAGPWADLVRARLSELGVRLVDAAAHTGYKTPLTTVLVASKSGTRTIVNPPTTNPQFAFPAAWDPSWGPPPTIALTDGFHLRETLPLLRALQKAGVALCLDGGSWKEGTDQLAPLLTAAICSERFAPPDRDSTPDSTLAWFTRQGVPFAAVTRGSRPILASDHGRRFEIPVRQIQAIDTLGAGDVLHGAFCFFVAQGEPFEAALRQAAEVATRSCQALGIDDLARLAQ